MKDALAHIKYVGHARTLCGILSAREGGKDSRPVCRRCSDVALDAHNRLNEERKSTSYLRWPSTSASTSTWSWVVAR